MDQQDRAFMTVFSAVLGVLVLIAVLIFILAHLIVDDDSANLSALRMEQAAKLLEKPGRVIVSGTPEAEQEQASTAAAMQPASGSSGGAAAAALDGATIYEQVCAACHTSGVLNAPKVGDNAEWMSRNQKGLDTLLRHAVQGFNQMPAQSPGVPEEGVKAAILHILNQSGIEVGGGETAAASDAQSSEQTAAQAATDSPDSEPTADDSQETAQQAAVPAPPLESEAVQNPPVPSQTTVETPPVPAASEQAASVTESQAETQVTAQQAAVPAPPLESEAVQNPPVPSQTTVETPPVPTATEQAPAGQATTEQTASLPAPPLNAETAQTPPVPAVETQPAGQAPATESQATPEPVTASTAGASEPAGVVAMPSEVDLAQGQQTYENVCRFCHIGTLPTAPKFGDKEAWASRLAQGWDTLKDHTLNGFKGMPPKGGRPDLSDEQVLNALGYMIENSQ